MAKVLIIYGSVIPRENSISTKMLDLFVDEHKRNNINDEIKILDLNNEDMYSLTDKNFKLFYSEENSDKYINLLKSVDKVVMNAPMINFNIPTIIKAFFDRIAVANKTFSYKYASKGSSIGLLNNLKVQIIATQGAPLGWYPWASHINYLEGMWKFLGANLSESILLAGTKVEPLNKMQPQEIIETISKEIIKKASIF